MRTTLTLDADVAERLKEATKESGASFKEMVNLVLRRGFSALEEPPPERRFRVRARPLGAKPGVSFDNIGELLHDGDEIYRL